MDYGNPWRPNYEARGAVLWVAVAVIAVGSAGLWDLHEATFEYLGAAAGVMALTWTPRALRHHWRLRRLQGKPLAFMSAEQLDQRVRARPDRVWLGWGFEWTAGHAQLAHDLLRVGPEQVVKSLEDRLGAQWIHGLGSGERPIRLPVSHIEGHLLVVGTTGAGKTRLFDLLVAQAVKRGEPVVIIDPKGDHDLRLSAQRACADAPERFIYFHPAFPGESCRIDPLYSFNRPSELASRVAALIPSETGSDPFKAFSQMAMTHVIQGLLAVQDRPSLIGLRRYLEGGVDALMVRVLEAHFAAHVPSWEAQARRFVEKARDTAGRAAGLLRCYQERVRHDHPSTVVDGLANLFEHERVHFSKMVASLMPVLTMLTSADLGPLLSPHDSVGPDPRPIMAVAEVVERGQVLYVGLDSLSDAMVGSALGSILIADLASVAGSRYNQASTVLALNVFIDESAEVVNDPFIQLLNKGRGARLRLTIATQTFADFSARTGSEAKARQVLGNINNMIVLRALDTETQAYVTDSFPKTTVRSLMTTQGSNSSGTDPLLFTGNVSERLSEEEAELFPPALLGHLPNLHYIAQFAGGRIVKGRLPILGSPKAGVPRMSASAGAEDKTVDWLGATVRAVLLLLIEFIVVSMLIPVGRMEAIRTSEREAMQAALGVNTAAAIIVTATDWYDTLFVAPGLVAGTYRMVTLSPQDVASAKASGIGPLTHFILWQWIEERVQVLWGTIEQAVRRVVLLVSWWPFAAILGAVAVADGLLRRRIRQWSFAYASPLRHTLAMRVMVWTLALATFALFLPIAWSPLIPPTVMVVVALLLGIALAHTQKRV